MACGRVRALRIGKPLLDQLVAKHPPFGDVLLEILSRRLIATLVRTNPIFTAFDDATRRHVARLFEVRRAPAGTLILEAGKSADGLYLPLHGRVVSRRADGKRLGNLDLGIAIGQESMLLRQPSKVTIEAASDLLVLRMPAAQFADLLLQRPDVVQHMQVLKRRSTEYGHSHSPR